MRLKLLLTVQPGGEKPNVLPTSYQNELSAWLYKLIDSGNSDFNKWLAEYGAKNNRQAVSPFTYSSLSFPENGIERTKEGIALKDGIILELTVSFLLADTHSEAISSLFINQSFSIGDKISKAYFKVTEILVLPLVEATESVHLKTVTPIVLSKTKQNGKIIAIEYPEPGTRDFELLFLQDLSKKYVEARAKSLVLSAGNIDGFKIEVLNEPKQRSLKLYKNDQEVKVKGWQFEFQLSGSAELIRIGLMGGFGEDTTIGCGYCEVI